MPRGVLVALSLTLAACGGAQSTVDAGAPDCASATAALCTKGAMCSGTASAVIRVDAGTATHESANDCSGYYLLLVCPNATTASWPTCTDAIQASTCTAGTPVAAPIPPECAGLTL
ncbi:MAG: hypothetical protein JNG84_01290 [Archangium sp.]|nr:hypothetical protein [Archangium sp.]